MMKKGRTLEVAVDAGAARVRPRLVLSVRVGGRVGQPLPAVDQRGVVVLDVQHSRTSPVEEAQEETETETEGETERARAREPRHREDPNSSTIHSVGGG